MKKALRLALASAATLAIAACVCFAADTAKVYRGEIYAEGRATFAVSEAGGVVPFLSYNDSTYIPIRSASGWMGKNIKWDGATKTITIDGKTEPNFISTIKEGQLDRVTVSGNVEVAVQRDVKIILDGAVQSFKNQRGEAVYPIMYNDINYLPLRNIGEMTDMDVKWVRISTALNGDTHDMVFIGTKMTDAQKQEAVDYIAGQSELAKKADMFLKEIRLNAQKADVSQLVIELDSTYEKMMSAEKPTAKVAEYTYNRGMQSLAELRAQCEKMKKLDGIELYNMAQEMVTTRMGVDWAHIQMSMVLEQDGKSYVPYVLNRY